MIIKICIHCGDEFDLSSPAKIKAGGKTTECPDCSEETVVKYAGVQAADGKQAQATILKFDSEQDKSQYINFWQNNSGLHRGKSCQIGSHISTTPKIKFETVTSFNPTNHKGKAI
jgi:DNA-directed RNA polymerase subunit RPC12/RpoP